MSDSAAHANYQFIIGCAKNLRSEHGENLEYDRAMLEFVREMTGQSHEVIADDLDLNLGKLYPNRVKKRYSVSICRTVWKTKSFTVTARDLGEARDLALEKAANSIFSGDDGRAEYKVHSITALDTK